MTTPSPPSNPFQFGVPVPSLIWDTFEDALRGNMRRLVRDIATTLGQSEAPLLDAVLKGPAALTRPYLFEESDTAEKEVGMRCDYRVQRPDAPLFLQPCGAPVLWTATASSPGAPCRCPTHLYTKRIIQPRMVNLAPLEMSGLDAADYGGRLYKAEDGTVYDVEFKPRGFYHTDAKRLVLFQDEAEAK